LSGDKASWHMPFPRRAGRVLARTGIYLGALLLVLLASHPLWLAPWLGRHLTQTSGRAVHFDSVRIGLTSSLAPVVHLRGVRIDNAAWAEDQAPFAALADAVFVFAWRRFEGRHVVSHLLLRDGAVHLEQGVDGLRNWRLSDPQDRGPGHYWFDALEAHGVEVGFVHQGIDLHVDAVEHDVAAAKGASGEALAARIDVEGAYHRVGFKGSVDTGAVLSFLETGRWFGLRGHCAIDGVDLDVDGRAADLFRSPRVDADAVFSGRSLVGLRPLLGARYAEPRAFRVQGHVRSDGDRYQLESARAQVGTSDLAGALAWSRSGDRQAVRAELRGEHVDLADLLWLAGRPSAGFTVATADAATPPSGRRGLLADARDFDADIDFEAVQLRAAAWRAVQSLRLKARLVAGQLVVSDFDLGWAGGHTRGRLGLDLRQPLALLDVALATSGVRVESLFPAGNGDKHLSGTLRASLALKASGSTVEALRDSLRGAGSARLRDGTISSLLDAEMGLEGGKLVRTLLSGSEPLALPCAAARFDVNEGRAHLRELVVESANTRTVGSGSLDLRDLSIDLVLTPQPKRPGVFELRRSIRFFGPLPRPQRTLVARVEPSAGAACEASAS
jgi:AsmA family protein